MSDFTVYTDEQLVEAARDAATSKRYLEALRELQAKIAALEADAARYRYIRNKQNPLERINQSTLHDYGLSCYHDVGGVRELKSEGELDTAIDAAMQAKP